MRMNRETITFQVPTELKRDVRIAAAVRGVSPSELIRKAIENDVKREPAVVQQKRRTSSAA